MPKIFLDDLVKLINDDVSKMIKDADAFYDREITELAEILSEDYDKHIVLLAGPSGSGKTTTANILKDKIVEKGRNAAVVSLDNFFKNKDEYPKNEDCSPDFESVYALDIDHIHQSLSEIVKNGCATIPRFDFPNQRRSDKTDIIDVGESGIIIIEGIHALNPIIADTLPQNSIMKVFVSVSTGIKNNDGKEILSGIQIRMLRRVIRDRLYRGFSAENTLKVWKSVLMGERKYLYPYKPLADFKINTFHTFEPFVYAEFIRDNMTDEVEKLKDDEYYEPFEVVKGFPGIELTEIPNTSLIMEFVPGGKYESLY